MGGTQLEACLGPWIPEQNKSSPDLVHHINNVHLHLSNFLAGETASLKSNTPRGQWPHHDRGLDVLLAKRQEMNYFIFASQSCTM